MTTGRLPAKLEVDSLLRSIQADGGFATILRRGDPESGAMLLIVTSRGRHFACLERVLNVDGSYGWRRELHTRSA